MDGFFKRENSAYARSTHICTRHMAGRGLTHFSSHQKFQECFNKNTWFQNHLIFMRQSLWILFYIISDDTFSLLCFRLYFIMRVCYTQAHKDREDYINVSIVKKTCLNMSFLYESQAHNCESLMHIHVLSLMSMKFLFYMYNCFRIKDSYFGFPNS